MPSQSSGSRYWPDDDELRDDLDCFWPIAGSARATRMVLEAIEDYKRGWRDGKSGLGDERSRPRQVRNRARHAAEMGTHWPAPTGPRPSCERDRLIHTMGNLTLLTKRLNSKVSNGPWLGDEGKRSRPQPTRRLLAESRAGSGRADEWTDEAIRHRTEQLAAIIGRSGPCPLGIRLDSHAGRLPPVVIELACPTFSRPGCSKRECRCSVAARSILNALRPCSLMAGSKSRVLSSQALRKLPRQLRAIQPMAGGSSLFSRSHVVLSRTFGGIMSTTSPWRPPTRIRTTMAMRTRDSVIEKYRAHLRITRGLIENDADYVRA